MVGTYIPIYVRLDSFYLPESCPSKKYCRQLDMIDSWDDMAKFLTAAAKVAGFTALRRGGGAYSLLPSEQGIVICYPLLHRKQGCRSGRIRTFLVGFGKFSPDPDPIGTLAI